MEVKQIATGFINDILKREEDLHIARMSVCKECPILDKTPFGPVCSNKMYYNKETKKVYQYPCDGCINGCGCLLNKKTRVRIAKCPLGKWKE